MELTSYVNTESHIVSTIRWTKSFQDMLETMNSTDLHPFNRVRIIRHTKTNDPVRIQFIKDRVLEKTNHPDSFHPNSTNSTPSTLAMATIHNRNRGAHEPKPYARFLELSQPKEKDFDSTY
jgi:hypothetical protein